MACESGLSIRPQHHHRGPCWGLQRTVAPALWPLAALYQRRQAEWRETLRWLDRYAPRSPALSRRGTPRVQRFVPFQTASRWLQAYRPAPLWLVGWAGWQRKP